MDYKIASVATQWWINQMKKQCKKSYPDKITGDDSNLIIVDSSMKNEFSRFEKALFNHILNTIRFKSYTCLTCCYCRPSGDLALIIRKTSISNDYLPERASMEIGDGFIDVSINGEASRKLRLPTK